MRITDAGPADLRQVVALEEAFPEHQRWSEASWAEELSATSRVALAARDGDRLIGVVLLAIGPDFTDLHRIVVAPDAQRRGTADRLMRAALDRVPTRVLLEVRDDNEPALRLYRKHGFSTIDRRRDYYGAGVDALILERRAEEEKSA